jgi:hypothetical protein
MTIWLEPGEEFYTTPLTDSALLTWIAGNGIDASKVREYYDAAKWRWFEERDEVVAPNA